MAFSEQNSDSEIRILCKKAIEELQKVNSDSNLQKKNIDITSDKKKKQIITELGKNLENKTPTNTVCIEIVNQLRGTVSESFIRKCLDQKYKDTHRSENAKQQNKVHVIKPKKTDLENIQDGLNKVDEEYQTIIIRDNTCDIDRLALIGVLDQENAKERGEREEREEEQLQEIVLIAGNNGSQILIRRDESNSFDKDIPSDTNFPDLDSKIPSIEKDNQSSSDLSGEPSEQNLPSKCSDCEKKDKLIHLKNIIIEQLEQIIKKSPQLVTADKLTYKLSTDRIEEATKQKIPFNLVIPFENLRRDMASNNRLITSNMKIVFSGYFDQDTGKVFDSSWKIIIE